MSGFTLIDDVVLESAASAINIPVDTAFRKFRVTLFLVKGTNAGGVTIRFNSDSGSNYARQELAANGTSTNAQRATGLTNIPLVGSANVIANGTAIATAEIEKPLATTPARISTTAGFTRDPGGEITQEQYASEWNNTTDLIDEITLTIAGTSAAAVGTRCVIEGAMP